MFIDRGWLSDARVCVSPNYNARPSADEINALIIHNISLPPEQFGGSFIEDFFQNKLDCSLHPFFKEIEGVEVSSHLLITRQGELVQFVPFDQRAWHAGKSSLCGQENCNDFSIGIELEGSDDIPYTEVQYQQLAAVTNLLLVSFPHITRDRIVGHSDIAPGRKTDPGPSFDWVYYRSLIQA